MPALPTIGTLSYNGIPFGPLTRSKIDAKPVYDQAGRTVAYVEYTLSITSYILPQSLQGTTDGNMVQVRQLLTQPAGALHYDDSVAQGGSTGFGSVASGFPLSINTGQNNPGGFQIQDVVWGPKPQLIRMQPVGSSQCWLIEWTCQVAIPECLSAKYAGVIMALNYDARFHIDSDGYTTRIITGYLEIPMTRANVNSRALPDIADAYREQINLPPVPGFRREQDYHISLDKRRLDFSFVDTELPVDGLPRDVTAASGRHRIQSPSKTFRGFWTGHLSASYTVARNVPKSETWDIFMALLIDRLALTQINGKFPDGLLFVELVIDEGLYENSKVTSFDLTYLFTSTAGDFLADSKLWRQLPNTNAFSWTQSMINDNVFVPRGSAGMKMLPTDDMILDLCLSQPAFPNDNSSIPQASQPEQGLGPVTMDPNHSWLHYECELRTKHEPGRLRHKPLPTSPGTNSMTLENPAIISDSGIDPLTGKPYQGPDATGGTDGPISSLDPTFNVPNSTNYTNDTGIALAGALSGNPPADIVQQRVTPSITVVLSGMAIRANNHIPYPTLQKIGATKPDGSDAITPVIDDQDVTQECVANWAGVPIYMATWELEYIVPSLPPGEFALPINPSLQVAG